MKVLSNNLQSKIITLINTNVSKYINKNVLKTWKTFPRHHNHHYVALQRT